MLAITGGVRGSRTINKEPAAARKAAAAKKPAAARKAAAAKKPAVEAAEKEEEAAEKEEVAAEKEEEAAEKEEAAAEKEKASMETTKALVASALDDSQACLSCMAYMHSYFLSCRPCQRRASSCTMQALEAWLLQQRSCIGTGANPTFTCESTFTAPVTEAHRQSCSTL